MKRLIVFILLITSLATTAQDNHVSGNRTARPVYNAIAYLGFGQGDTTSAINQAIQDASTHGGGDVLLPAGLWGTKTSYLSGSTYRPVGIVGASNVTLQGEGIGQTIIVQDAPPAGATFDSSTFISNAHFSSIIRCTNCTNFRVENLSINGTFSRQINRSTNAFTNPQDGNAADSSQTDGVYFNGGKNNSAYNVRLDSVQGYGFRAEGAYQSIFDHVIATTTINGGVYFAGMDNGSVLSNSFITNNSCDNVRLRTGNISIINNEISWSQFNNRGGTNSNFAGIYVENDGGSATTNILVSGNYLHDNSSYGFDCANIDTTNYTFTGVTINIVNNQIVHNAASGGTMHLQWMKVTGNTFVDNGVDSLGITDPEGAFGYGLSLHGSFSNGAFIDGNTFKSSSSVLKQQYAMASQSVGTVPILTFTNNSQFGGLDLIDVSSFGLQASSPYNVVYGNSVFDSTRTFRPSMTQDNNGFMHWSPRQPGLNGGRTGVVFLESDLDAQIQGTHKNDGVRAFYLVDVFGTTGGASGMGLRLDEIGTYTTSGSGGVIGGREISFWDSQNGSPDGGINATGELFLGPSKSSYSLHIQPVGAALNTATVPSQAEIIATGIGSTSSLFETALVSTFNNGYSGANGSSAAGKFGNSNANSSNAIGGLGVASGNFGIFSQASGATSGASIGIFANTANALSSVGVIGDASLSQLNNASTKSIGVIGYAKRSNASAIECAGCFFLQNSQPTFASAALIADNSAETVPVALFRVNGTTTAQVDANGMLDPGATTTTDIGTSSLLWRNLFVQGIVGTITNNNASSGNIGEYVSSLVAIGSPVSLSNGIAANVTSISLTAGDWDVDGTVSFTETTSTVTARSAGITSTTATVPSDGSEAYCGVQSTVTSETNSIALTKKRFSLSGTTTIYLVGKASFSAGTCGGFGFLSARRVR